MGADPDIQEGSRCARGSKGGGETNELIKDGNKRKDCQ